MADDAPRTRIFLTYDVLTTGICTVYAAINGDVATWEIAGVPCRVAGEGIRWHRQRWAAQNFACQIKAPASASCARRSTASSAWISD